ncbi:HNH endonuclease signature motif containing protein [Demequina pelophila]|uniref:HNH endonuclease signature motif containing protein n=1 Tax=Demequina pelophila TaxID=1638984 RepID=UPI00138DFC46|nr:HNH endonuclease signature motif containing protein [Demequina pelophila]
MADLGAHDGADSRELDDDELWVALERACRLINEARVYAAPLAAQAKRRSPSRVTGFAKKAGHGSAERLIAALLTGTLAEAHRLIEAGMAADPEEDPPDPDDDDQGDSDHDRGDPDGADGADDDTDDTDDPDDDDVDDESDSQQQRPRERAHGPVEGSLAWAVWAGKVSVDAASRVRLTLTRLQPVLDGGALWQVELRLVRKAQVMTLRDLWQACLWEEAHGDPEGWKQKEARQRKERYLSIQADRDGMVQVRGQLDPASAAPFIAYLDAARRQAFQQARRAGENEERTAGQLNVDALAVLASHATGCEAGGGVRATVTVTMTLDQLTGGGGLASCDQAGGPVSAGLARRLAADAQVIPVVLGTRSEVLDVGAAARFFTHAQRRALAVRDGGCAWCHAAPSWCEAHHILPVSAGGPTDLSNGVLLCRSCHMRLHDTDWTIEVHDNTVWFRPPGSHDPARTAVLGGRHRFDAAALPDPPPPPPAGTGVRGGTGEAHAPLRT